MYAVKKGRRQKFWCTDLASYLGKLDIDWHWQRAVWSLPLKNNFVHFVELENCKQWRNAWAYSWKCKHQLRGSQCQWQQHCMKCMLVIKSRILIFSRMARVRFLVSRPEFCFSIPWSYLTHEWLQIAIFALEGGKKVTTDQIVDSSFSFLIFPEIFEAFFYFFAARKKSFVRFEIELF